MKILVAGYGTVGKAHETYLRPSFDVEIYDPMKGYNDISKDIDGVIICTATPSFENGACIVNSVYDVISRVPNVPIIIKSTISLEGWKAIKQDFPKYDITFSPEFLRNKTATEDLANSEYFMLAEGNTQFWSTVLVTMFGTPTINLYNKAEELILVKYLLIMPPVQDSAKDIVNFFFDRKFFIFDKRGKSLLISLLNCFSFLDAF